ncbi:MAB_1171c family putative transporter [Actinokineospora bangkokensis]|uniref:DUF6545 domain-containing protein n=1 Tax=Actinokineospora bangkokensis TaxID=1193682 RepID=A0A1Q9LPP4_9PSEU|nr:MAB_1171c family putative transporter [Actinokineospora bangkokensis]OLR93953.1 hypothetical protein BJP25_13230 [Actinokineospora bangkokensis]
MTPEHLLLLITAVVAVALAHRTVAVLRAPSPAQWWLWATFALLLLSLALTRRDAAALLDGLFAGGSWIIPHTAALATMFALQAFYVLSVRPPGGVRAALGRGLAVMGALGAVLLVSWAAAQAVESPAWAAVDWVTEPLASLTNLLYVSLVAAFQVVNARLTLRWARVADRPWLARGLRLLTIGNCCNAVWSAHRAGAILAGRFDVRPPWPQAVVELSLLAVGLTTCLLGVALPAWGPRLDAARAWASHYRSYRRLTPLWEALRAATPGIELPAAAPWWRMEYRLHRRVIEIWDGRAALRPYLLSHGEADPGAEARALSAAIEAKRTGAPPRSTPGTSSREGSDDLESEVLWLEDVVAAGEWSR